MGSAGSKGSSSGDILFITAMSNHTKFDKKELQSLAVHFDEVAKKKEPHHLIDRENFADVLKAVNICENDRVILDHLFTLFDETCDDRINYKEFVYALSTLIRGSLKEKLEFSFKMFDQNGDGVISKTEFKAMLVAMNQAVSFFGDQHMSEGDVAIIVDDVYLKHGHASKDAAEGEKNLLNYQEYHDAVIEHPEVVSWLKKSLKASSKKAGSTTTSLTTSNDVKK